VLVGREAACAVAEAVLENDRARGNVCLPDGRGGNDFSLSNVFLTGRSFGVEGIGVEAVEESRPALGLRNREGVFGRSTSTERYELALLVLVLVLVLFFGQEVGGKDFLVGLLR